MGSNPSLSANQSVLFHHNLEMAADPLVMQGFRTRCAAEKAIALRTVRIPRVFSPSAEEMVRFTTGADFFIVSPLSDPSAATLVRSRARLSARHLGDNAGLFAIRAVRRNPEFGYFGVAAAFPSARIKALRHAIKAGNQTSIRKRWHRNILLPVISEVGSRCANSSNQKENQG